MALRHLLVDLLGAAPITRVLVAIPKGGQLHLLQTMATELLRVGILGKSGRSAVGLIRQLTSMQAAADLRVDRGALHPAGPALPPVGPALPPVGPAPTEETSPPLVEGLCFATRLRATGAGTTRRMARETRAETAAVEGQQ